MQMLGFVLSVLMLNMITFSIFEYGTTSKFDAEGNAVGTGLGMYIVASSINEYKGRYTITKVEDGFGLDITIPLSEEGR